MCYRRRITEIHWWLYIVKKFSLKYPDLGQRPVESASRENTWVDYVNKGGLQTRSDSFMLNLVKMRETFNSVHGSYLKEGKYCLKEIVTEMEKVVDDVPHDVKFFAKNLFISE